MKVISEIDTPSTSRCPEALCEIGPLAFGSAPPSCVGALAKERDMRNGQSNRHEAERAVLQLFFAPQHKAWVNQATDDDFEWYRTILCCDL